MWKEGTIFFTQGLFEAGLHCQSECENLININSTRSYHDWNHEKGLLIGGYIYRKSSIPTGSGRKVSFFKLRYVITQITLEPPSSSDLAL